MWKRGKKAKLLMGQDIVVPILWVCMSLSERCVGKAEPGAEVSVACGEGSEGLMNSCPHKDSPTGIYENPFTIKHF